jgi:DNA polymerase-1
MTRDEAIQAAKVLKALIKYAEAAKILGTFIKALKENSVLKEDGNYYLHGNFSITGTKSGRQSSSSPNLTNLPSGSSYGKLIKSCFKTPKGKVMLGADFDALEAKVSALLTQDPNKLKVYTEGYDSHSLNAFGYFPKELPGIISTVESINSIAEKFPKIRQKSKTITFAAQYGGTHFTFMESGFTKEEALEIERNYHKLYVVADAWVQDRMVQATKVGYVTLAFGLRLRTPILAQSILSSASVPYEAKAEARTAGNATQQSYGLLNSRAAIAMQQRIWDSPYALDILPICAIHDSQYFSVADNAECIEWFNNNLIECMSWTGLPEIQHDIVKISATAEIFYPSWEVSAKLPNRSTQAEITAIGRTAHKKYLEELINAVG